MSEGELTFETVMVVDGTGSPGFVASVDVRGDRIVAVRRGEDDRPTLESAEEVDGAGLTLTPGFIDVHSHDDYAVLMAPEHACKTLQGVTSVVNGNCGMSPTPVNEMVPGVPTSTRPDHPRQFVTRPIPCSQRGRGRGFEPPGSCSQVWKWGRWRGSDLVETMGIEPTTRCLQSKRL